MKFFLIRESSHAYDVWQYMVRKGYYPLEQADQQMIRKIGGMYQVAPEDKARVNQLAKQYQASVDGNSRNMYR